MLSYRMRTPGSAPGSRGRQIDWEFLSLDVSNSLRLTMTEIGEHQDNPKHPYHRPNTILLETSISRDQAREMINSLGRIL